MLVFAYRYLAVRGAEGGIDCNQAMTIETYTIIGTIIGVAVSLAGLILSGQRAAAETRRELIAFREQSGRELAAFREQSGQEFAALRERMAHLEGLLEGLREAIVGKAA